MSVNVFERLRMVSVCVVCVDWSVVCACPGVWFRASVNLVV